MRDADIYERVTPRGRKPTFRTLLMTQVVAGIWHGLFPGYAMFFVSSAFMFESAKIIYRYEEGLPARWQWIRTFLPWQLVKFLYTGVVLNYCASAFLASPPSRVCYCPYISAKVLAVTCVAFVAALGPRFSRKWSSAAQNLKKVPRSWGGCNSYSG